MQTHLAGRVLAGPGARDPGSKLDQISNVDRPLKRDTVNFNCSTHQNTAHSLARGLQVMGWPSAISASNGGRQLACAWAAASK